MKHGIAFGLCLIICLTIAANAQVKSAVGQAGKNTKPMTKLAKGTFEVKVTPLAAEENVGDPTISRLSLDKTFSGDLAGTSKGQMLGSQNETEKDTGGYVAMERFTGTLDGRKGGFALQHNGTMGGGIYEIYIQVVPGTGTGELAGITGKMKIIIEKGKHFYEFEYSFAKAK